MPKNNFLRAPSVQEAVFVTSEEVVRELKALRDNIKTLEKNVNAVAEQALAKPDPVVNVPAPIVNVPAPVVNVDGPVIDNSDLTRLLGRIEAAITAFSSKPSGPFELGMTDREILTKINTGIDSWSKLNNVQRGSLIRGGGSNILGLVSTSDPTYADSSNQKLSLTTSGRLRVDATFGLPTGASTSANQSRQIDLQKMVMDMFGQNVSASRYNQFQINYAGVDPDAITAITVTKTNGGDASTADGQAVFETSTNTNGEIKAVTTSTIEYAPHYEIYAAFTAVFSTGLASSFQRLGIFDTNNGFFIGYEGTSFGITKRTAAVDTTTAQASFNIDTLTGGTTSKFTRNGTPEALDPTKDNLYRIRYGWLGAAPILFEIFSPDGEWIPFHIIRIPNSQTVPSLSATALPITLHAKKTTAGATNVSIKTACWAAGTTSDLQKVSATITDDTLVKPVRAVLTAKKPDQSYTNIDATAGGNLKVSIEEVDGAVTIPVVEERPTTASVGSIAASASSVTLLSTNTSRRGATFYNDSSSACYLKYGTTASTSSFTVKIFGNGYHEIQRAVYTGRIDCIWDSATGNMRITELT